MCVKNWSEVRWRWLILEEVGQLLFFTVERRRKSATYLLHCIVRDNSVSHIWADNHKFSEPPLSHQASAKQIKQDAFGQVTLSKEVKHRRAPLLQLILPFVPGQQFSRAARTGTHTSQYFSSEQNPQSLGKSIQLTLKLQTISTGPKKKKKKKKKKGARKGFTRYVFWEILFSVSQTGRKITQFSPRPNKFKWKQIFFQ